MTSKERNRLSGIFLLAHAAINGVLNLIAFSFMVLIVGAADGELPGFFLFIMMFAGFFALASLIPQLVGGWKLLKERPDARNWGIVGAIVACLNVPLGTAAGIFTLVFLFGDDGRKFYEPYNRTPGELNAGDRSDEVDFEEFRDRQPHGWR
ncbi:MAG: hypothetical protein KIS76_09985 [Pyrinomonadaceae bacterium]|nr:hypothetical protein [Pyrinomonadaceae bacterium]